MKPIELASVSLKMLGIYSFLKAIPIVRVIIDTKNLHNLKAFDPSTNFSMVYLGAIISLILFIMFGICLLFFGNKIAAKIVQDKDYLKQNQTLESRSLQAVAISVVGVLIVALVIPKLFQFSVNLYAMRTPEIEAHLVKKYTIDNIALGIGILAQLIVGLLLFLGGSFLSMIWHKFLNRFEHEMKLK